MSEGPLEKLNIKKCHGFEGTEFGDYLDRLAEERAEEVDILEPEPLPNMKLVG